MNNSLTLNSAYDVFKSQVCVYEGSAKFIIIRDYNLFLRIEGKGDRLFSKLFPQKESSIKMGTSKEIRFCTDLDLSLGLSA